MRFTIEQVFLTDARGSHSAPQTEYHLVEADDVDAALAQFFNSHNATLVGTIQKYPGYQAVATARTEDAVFTVNLLPGSEAFRRHS